VEPVAEPAAAVFGTREASPASVLIADRASWVRSHTRVTPLVQRLVTPRGSQAMRPASGTSRNPATCSGG
jgi:hypothetical protein